MAAALLALHLVAWSASSSPAQEGELFGREAGGFASPVLVIPEVGLWADALAELRYGKRPGLVVWWGLESVSGSRGSETAKVDWNHVSFRIRVEVLDDKGKRIALKQEIVEPLRRDDFAERGGFPTPVHVVLNRAGQYRVRLEAYPLISAEQAGLDSVPRGIAEIDATLPEWTLGGQPWGVSDLLFIHALEDWQAGAPPERTWYEWVLTPSVPRAFDADSSSVYLTFEIQRAEEPVSRCQRSNCRVVVSVLDEDGGIVDRMLRAVPEAQQVNAYVIELDIAGWPPGSYRAEVVVFVGADRITSTSRSFEILPGKS